MFLFHLHRVQYCGEKNNSKNSVSLPALVWKSIKCANVEWIKKTLIRLAWLFVLLVNFPWMTSQCTWIYFGGSKLVIQGQCPLSDACDLQFTWCDITMPPVHVTTSDINRLSIWKSRKHCSLICLLIDKMTIFYGIYRLSAQILCDYETRILARTVNV